MNRIFKLSLSFPRPPQRRKSMRGSVKMWVVDPASYRSVAGHVFAAWEWKWHVSPPHSIFALSPGGRHEIRPPRVSFRPVVLLSHFREPLRVQGDTDSGDGLHVGFVGVQRDLSLGIAKGQ